MSEEVPPAWRLEAPRPTNIFVNRQGLVLLLLLVLVLVLVLVFFLFFFPVLFLVEGFIIGFPCAPPKPIKNENNIW